MLPERNRKAAGTGNVSLKNTGTVPMFAENYGTF